MRPNRLPLMQHTRPATSPTALVPGASRVQVRVQGGRSEDEGLQEQGGAPRGVQGAGFVQAAGAGPQDHPRGGLHVGQEAGLRREGLLQEARVGRAFVVIEMLFQLFCCEN